MNYNGKTSQLRALHLALCDIHSRGGLTINGLITDVSRASADPRAREVVRYINPSTIYRFIERPNDNNLRLSFDIASALYNFLLTSPKYTTDYISVFSNGSHPDGNSLFYELRAFFSVEEPTDESRGALDVLSYAEQICGTFEVSKRPWMLPMEDRDKYELKSKLVISSEEEGNVVSVSDHETYDGRFGGIYPVDEISRGYLFSFGRNISFITKCPKSVAVSFVSIIDTFPSIDLGKPINMFNANFISSRLGEALPNYTITARRVPEDIKSMVILKNT